MLKPMCQTCDVGERAGHQLPVGPVADARAQRRHPADGSRSGLPLTRRVVRPGRDSEWHCDVGSRASQSNSRPAACQSQDGQPHQHVDADEHHRGDAGVGWAAARRTPSARCAWSVAPSLTQSGHWKPTAESRMQSGQIDLLAALAADVGLAVRVPVAGRAAPAAGLGRLGARVGLGWLGGRAQPRLISTCSMTTGSTGWSPRPVGVVSMASTTSREAWSATSPKMVCLKFSHGVGAHGDEELRAVGARAGVGHGQQVGLVEGQLGVRLVLERVAGTAGAGAERAAALDHEAADHAVEARARRRTGRTGRCRRCSPWCPRRGRRSCRRSRGRGSATGSTVMSPRLVLRTACRSAMSAFPRERVRRMRHRSCHVPPAPGRAERPGAAAAQAGVHP